MDEKLRVAVLFNSDIVPAWLYQMLSKIDQSLSSEFVLLIKSKPPIKEKSNYFVYNMYTKLDKKHYKLKPDAFEPKSIKSLLDVETIDMEDISDLKKYNIDIIVELAPNILTNEILQIANYGVWSYVFCDTKKSQDTPNVFWEVIERKGKVGITLVMQKTNQNIVLATSCSLTDNLSVARSKNSYYWKAASILPRTINELHRLGKEQFLDNINELNQDSNFFSEKKRSVPTNGKVIVKLVKFKWKRFQNIIRSFFYFDQWILQFYFGNFENISINSSQFKKIIPPKEKFWADPHVIKKNGFYYIFIEELIYTENKGFISVIEMDDKGKYKDPVKILERDYHLSFPFIIEDNGEIYMIPESKQNKNIQLYKCIDFPYKWDLETILMDNVGAVDTVIIEKDNKYWLFTNMIANEGASFIDELYLFSSDSLVSNQWKSHPLNPIVSDVKNARMAGRLFTINNILYRPSQNCSNHYGYGVQINQVLELTENRYKEKIVDSLFPDFDDRIKSIHSLSVLRDISIIDAQYKRRR